MEVLWNPVFKCCQVHLYGVAGVPTRQVAQGKGYLSLAYSLSLRSKAHSHREAHMDERTFERHLFSLLLFKIFISDSF